MTNAKKDTTVCFFNPDRHCIHCAAYIKQTDGCSLIAILNSYTLNQAAQTELLEGMREVQKKVLPMLDKMMPMLTKAFELAEKFVPLAERQADVMLKEIEEDVADAEERRTRRRPAPRKDPNEIVH